MSSITCRPSVCVLMARGDGELVWGSWRMSILNGARRGRRGVEWRVAHVATHEMSDHDDWQHIQKWNSSCRFQIVFVSNLFKHER